MPEKSSGSDVSILIYFPVVYSALKRVNDKSCDTTPVRRKRKKRINCSNYSFDNPPKVNDDTILLFNKETLFFYVRFLVSFPVRRRVVVTVCLFIQ